jgi:hypothetical protein
MTLPAATPFVPDEDADADAVNTRFENIENRFNHGIIDEDISDTALIRGTKLSNRSGEQIPTDRLANNAVTSAKLQQDVANNANRAVGTDHIQDAAVTGAKIASSASVDATRAIGADHIKTGAANNRVLGVTKQTRLFSNQDINPGARVTSFAFTVTPTTAIPDGTAMVLSVVLEITNLSISDPATVYGYSVSTRLAGSNIVADVVVHFDRDGSDMNFAFLTGGVHFYSVLK